MSEYDVLHVQELSYGLKSSFTFKKISYQILKKYNNLIYTTSTKCYAHTHIYDMVQQYENQCSYGRRHTTQYKYLYIISQEEERN